MEIKRMLRSFAAVLSCAVMMGYAAEPLCWERTPNRPAPAQFDTFHGQSLDFRCTFTGFGVLPFSGSGAVAPRLYYQTNGMAAAWWSLPATVSYTVVTNCQLPTTNYQLSALFPPSADPGAERLAVFFGAPSNAYAAAQVRFRNSPGPHPNDLEPPSVLDWQAELTAATNALWASSAAAFMPQTNAYTKAETDARIVELSPPTSLAPATNYVDALRDDLVNGGLEVSTAQSAGYANEAETSASSGNAEYAENLTDHETDSRSATQIFSQIDSKTTTNDVCNIVTNETGAVHGNWNWPDTIEISGYTCYYTAEWPDWGNDGKDYYRIWSTDDDWDFETIVWEDGEEEGSGTWEPGVSYTLFDGDGVTETDTTITIEFHNGGPTISATRTYTPGRNALGLARESDIAPVVSNTVTQSYIEDLLPGENDPVWQREKSGYATTGQLETVSHSVGTLWSYVYGDSVWIAVTNYMRTVSGVSPSFQLWEVRDGTTNLVYWSKEEITNVTHDLIHDCKTNLEATVRNAVAGMPDKAWSKYQSATGNEAPDGVTIVSTPTIQLTGGGEWYRYIDVASNSVWFLKSNGLYTFGGDTNGYFRILDDEGNATFEVRKTDSYLVDAVASSVHFDEDGNFCVSFESNIQPVIYTTASLSNPNFQPEGDDANVTVTWTQSGGVYTATLEQTVKGPSLFAYAKVEVQGETVIRNTAPTDVSGGILCTDGIHKCRPVYNNGAITWEVMP